MCGRRRGDDATNDATGGRDVRSPESRTKTKRPSVSWRPTSSWCFSAHRRRALGWTYAATAMERRGSVRELDAVAVLDEPPVHRAGAVGLAVRAHARHAVDEAARGALELHATA